MAEIIIDNIYLTYADLDNEIREEECSICYGLLKEDKIVITKCGHTYHQECIDCWLKHKRICPLCRKLYQEDEMKTLYINLF